MAKRSLMLAGGGLKIAFQAGVLQVWLDEAGIEFDHGDGVSAATFNLAMWVQGFSGTQIAAGSLPLWFPPVRIDGDTYIDAVLNTATNLEEAIRRGADELWVIWTTSQRGQWRNGFIGNFFGIFEATTNHAYKQVLARIAANNAAIERGAPGEFGRTITVREIKSEVALPVQLQPAPLSRRSRARRRHSARMV